MYRQLNLKLILKILSGLLLLTSGIMMGYFVGVRIFGGEISPNWPFLIILFSSALIGISVFANNLNKSN